MDNIIKMIKVGDKVTVKECMRVDLPLELGKVYTVINVKLFQRIKLTGLPDHEFHNDLFQLEERKFLNTHLITSLILAELERTEDLKFNSLSQGYDVLRHLLDLCEEDSKDGNKDRIRDNAIKVAAAVIRLIQDFT